jgi:hypothetical protein
MIEKLRPEVVGEYMEVYSDPAANVIAAHVMVRKREIATREWFMGDEGIAVNCWCEKQNCRERGIVYRPVQTERLNGQLLGFIEAFANEYAVSLKKIRYFHVRQGQPFGEARLKVPASWKDPATLERAWDGFEALRIKNNERNW